MFNYQAIEAAALAEVAKHTPELEATALYNTEKVITAFRNNMVSDYYLKPTTGYGYSDVGRDTLDLIYAEIFKTEAALVRSQFVSGTHALAVALLGNLHPGDELIGLTGTPYDTMQSIIGYPVKTKGSLVDLGIIYKELPMTGGHVDLEAVKKAVTEKTTMVHIQRSCGYSSVRNTISVEEIGRIIKAAKEANPNVICFVDNCYGEFIDKQEPTEVGADIMAGSLIKNLGGGFAPTGGYIVGRQDLIENASYRLTAPGLGGEMGATLGDTQREFYQGLFLAPHVVMQAVKTAVFAAAVFKEMGYAVKPQPEEKRSDIIQAITLESKQRLCDFCIAIQSNSPVDAHVEPVPAPLPGYQDDIVMAAGTFVQGASIELSADGPCREPYNVFFQGGLTFEHGRLAIMAAAQRVGAKN
ncbi:methionine gamma-lyase family protein [uncultured Phascolarctobacterium sp.]|uniref:methionine gamma-lyase family protein n=1 Tax=uncultured Phascolarctobacterium sp. TaxID=512296 RepID=UPI002621893F|nr:methionine gamma-lyase family protein [uncultured Phascolarctobacterium sp.]